MYPPCGDVTWYQVLPVGLPVGSCHDPPGFTQVTVTAWVLPTGKLCRTLPVPVASGDERRFTGYSPSLVRCPLHGPALSVRLALAGGWLCPAALLAVTVTV